MQKSARSFATPEVAPVAAPQTGEMLAQPAPMVQRRAVPPAHPLAQRTHVLTLHRALGNHAVGQLLTAGASAQTPAPRPPTSLPAHLQSGVETLSGLAMDDVQVHYNSDKPAQVQALAYTQGTDIYVAPGQERHLAHEAWHVVQQKQGQVAATQSLAGLPLNDSPALEQEATRMGQHAQQGSPSLDARLGNAPINDASPIQRVVTPELVGGAGALSPASQDKIFEAVATLANAGLNLLPGRTVNVRLTVIDTPGLNPAVTQLQNANTISVDIQRWYIDISSVGEILGLLAHELGVHNLADLRLTDEERTDERDAQDMPFHVQVNDRLLGVGAWTAGDNNWDDQNRQRDHINVVRDPGGAAANAPARTRAYVDTLLNLGDALVGQPNAAEKQRHLVRTFLFDYARILVLNDINNPWRAAWDANVIAEAMQWYWQVIRNRHDAAHPWLAGVNLEFGGMSLRWWLVKKLSSFIVS